MNIDPTITIGAIGTFTAVLTTGIAIIAHLRGARREAESGIRSMTDDLKSSLLGRIDEMKDQITEIKVSLGERVSKLEANSTEFVPRREIEAKVEHEKGNRIQTGDALSRRIDGNANDIRILMIDVGGLKQRQDGSDQQMTELKAIVRDGFDRASQKIDRLADTIRERNVA